MADTPVSADTDDLNAFNDLLNGKAPEVAVADEPKMDADPVDDTIDANDDDAPAPEAADADVDTDASAEEDEDGDADADAQQDEVEDDAENIFKPKKKQTAKERINELTKKAHEAERRAVEAERRATEAEAARSAPKADDTPRQPARVVEDSDAPHPDAVGDDGSLVYPLGEYDPQYLADRTEYLVDKRLEAERASRAQTAEQTAREQADTALATAWEGKLAKSEAEIKDIRPTIATLDTHFRSLDPTYGTYLAQTIMDMDLGPEVLYYLANNTDEADAIVASGPQKATLALGRLEARIQTALAKKATPPRQTNAPKPAATTRGNAGASSVRPDTDDLEAFERQLFKKKT